MRAKWLFGGAAVSIAFGCNAITGVNDLRFGTGGGASFDAGIGGGASGGGAGGGGAGGSGGAGGKATADAGPSCGLVVSDPGCASCVNTKCCSVASTCAQDAECAAYRGCVHACADDSCVNGCVEQHQCGLSDWFAYDDCVNEECSHACGGGSGSDAGGRGSGSADAGSAASCDQSPCDPVAQCGCSAAQRCIVDDILTGTTSCAAAGAVPIGAICSASTDCVKGAGCVEGVCKSFCNSDADCEKSGRCYSITHDATGCTSVPTPGAGYCTAPCDVVHPELTCGAGASCATFPVDTSGTRATDCVVGGSGKGPGTCATNGTTDCAPGYDCVTYTFGATTTSNCSKWCRVGYPGDCGSDERCDPFAQAITLFGLNYGYCAKQCDLLAPSTVCGPLDGCRTITVGNSAGTDCFPAGGGEGVGACSDAARNTCAPGFECVGYATSPPTYSCEPYCVESNPSCTDGTSCDGLGETVLNGVGYSTCH